MDTQDLVVDVIIPAFNESQAIQLVLNDIPKNLVRSIIVVDNNSTDDTFAKAMEMGAIVVKQPIQGYGAACLKGLDVVESYPDKPDVIVFLDADYSDHPDEMPLLLEPLAKNTADLVIGSRALGDREQGSMMPQQIFGNWIATRMMKVLYGSTFTDLGPFRAIKYSALKKLKMRDMNYGWTVEMQVKALKQKLSYTEVPVSYRQRKGVSKITGTVKGSLMAGYKIILTILRYA
jgi:glycosyltransferase involved in cell wall biosynthesis